MTGVCSLLISESSSYGQPNGRMQGVFATDAPGLLNAMHQRVIAFVLIDRAVGVGEMLSQLVWGSSQPSKATNATPCKHTALHLQQLNLYLRNSNEIAS